MDFESRYKSLNEAQQQAVDCIDGPVMVIAGPGTGKTELLSLRVANILKQTDTLPENILCLTFTDSGANAMRERMVGLLGKDAYKVVIHTFHSFGSEVINQNSEFFYEGAHFRPADDLSRYEILRHIFESLGHANVLNKKMNGEYTYLKETLTVISELKKSGLTSDELLIVLDANDRTLQKADQLLGPIFADKPSKATAPKLAAHIQAIRDSVEEVALPNIVPLAGIIADSLQTAVDTAIETGKTTAVTAWRNAHFKKNDEGLFVMKSSERQTKLRAVSSIYEQYLARMSEAELFDFDDMILRVVHAIEIFDELRFNLQEKYQYILVDEFQDTNMAQMRIVHNLTNHPSQGDMPNVCVVGDDDQAIFSFQGADISNIINFRHNYPRVTTITLTENYRSAASILARSRDIIVQGTERLENTLPDLNKQLQAQLEKGEGSVTLVEADTVANERAVLVSNILAEIAAGTDPSNVAVLTRKHAEIEKLLPYFVRANIPVSYESQDDVLKLPPVVLVEQLARVLIAMYNGQHALANGLLPQVLAHPAWAISPVSLWGLSLAAFTNRTHWLDEMAKIPEFIPLHTWLITTALSIPHTPLETMLDTIIGAVHPQTADDEHQDTEPDIEAAGEFTSPIYYYFFSENAKDADAEQYIRYLEALRTIRAHLRDYRPLETPTLISFVDFMSLHKTIGSGITSVQAAGPSTGAVHIMTAHKSKGLEFDSVYIVGAVDSIWGEGARGHARRLSYPENLQLSVVGDSADERLRLFYVAATRAKKQLTISYALSGESTKATSKAAFLVSDTLSEQHADVTSSIDAQLETAELRWYEHLTPATSPTLAELLAPQLENYQLSVTHLTNFLDVTRGGPQNFLLQNLLRFPQAMSPASAYGSAIHATLQRAHMHLASHGQRQAVEDILHNFETSLAEHHLSDNDFEFYLQKGSEDLHAFLNARYNTFQASQRAELNFKSQHVMIGDAHLSGALDLVDIATDKSVTVTDYKTGKPLRSWVGKTDYEKLKLHKYKQQLMFYKLLIENARDFRGHTVSGGVLQFIEPTSVGNIIELDMSFTSDEVAEFTSLVQAVWKRIIALDLPDISGYDNSLKGVLAFEKDLLEDTV